MNRREAIETIKNATKAITLLFTGEKEEVMLEAVKLKQGDMMVDVQGELAEGTNVVTSSSTGSQDAADAEYELANGQIFTTKGGKIDKVISDGKNDEAEEAPADDAAPEEDKEELTDEAAPAAEDEAPVAEPASPDAGSTAALKALADKITEMDTVINAIKSALEGKATKQEMSAIGEQFTAIQSAFEVLADTPAEFSKVDKSVEAKDNKLKKLEALAGLANKG